MQTYADVAAILLAGGSSSRMGADKSGLRLQRKSLLEWQVDKIRSLPIATILIAGGATVLPYTELVADAYPRRGPLGGLHAGLQHSPCPCCLVLGVDIPLIPASALRDLILAHLSNDAEITLLLHNGQYEPLIGVYNSALAPRIAQLIQREPRSVRALIDCSVTAAFPYAGSDEHLLNCNTPGEYLALRTLVER